MPEFPQDWHWMVAGDENRFWSSAAGGYVETLPAGWFASIQDAFDALGSFEDAYIVTRIASEAELTDVLRAYDLPGPAPTAEDVKAEAARRILEIMPDYQQRNALALFAEAAQLHGPNPAEWPPELQATNNAVMAKWAAIKAIRQRSDEIEAMEPIPPDFRDDGYWTD